MPGMKIMCKLFISDARLCRRGSRINTDRFPILGRSGGMLPRVMFWILTPQSPLSWVSEPFRQDIYCPLQTIFPDFNLEGLKFLLKIYLL